MHTVIVGGGISGLILAWRLSEHGHPIILLEAAAHLGGNIQSVTQDGFLWEKGPNSLLLNHQELADFLRALDLTPLPANRLAKKRFVFDGKMLCQVPTYPWQMLTTPLLSWSAKRSLFKLLARQTPPTSEESLADFVTRRTHPEVVRWFLDPFISGIYAGDVHKLSYPAVLPRLASAERASGKLRPPKDPKRLPRQTVSFANGLHSMVHALTEGIHKQGGQIHTQMPVRALEPKNGDWAIHCPAHTFVARRVILAIPAYAIADLLPWIPESQALRDIVYPPVINVAFAFPKKAIRHPLNGFGFLIPRHLGLQTLGVLFSSSIFPNRAPAEHVLLTAFIGGRHNPHIHPTHAPSLILSEIRPILGITQDPLWYDHVFWARAIPQYEIGHLARLATFHTALEKYPNLYVRSNWEGGISLGDTIRNALTLANALCRT